MKHLYIASAVALCSMASVSASAEGETILHSIQTQLKLESEAKKLINQDRLLDASKLLNKINKMSFADLELILRCNPGDGLSQNVPQIIKSEKVLFETILSTYKLLKAKTVTNSCERDNVQLDQIPNTCHVVGSGSGDDLVTQCEQSVWNTLSSKPYH